MNHVLPQKVDVCVLSLSSFAPLPQIHRSSLDVIRPNYVFTPSTSFLVYVNLAPLVCETHRFRTILPSPSSISATGRLHQSSL